MGTGIHSLAITIRSSFDECINQPFGTGSMRGILVLCSLFAVHTSLVGQVVPPCFNPDAACCARAGSRLHAPEWVVCDRPSVDFDTIQQGAHPFLLWVLMNVSEDTVRVDDVQAASSSSVTPWWDRNRLVAPGDTVSVRAAFQSAGKTGLQSKALTVMIKLANPPMQNGTDDCGVHEAGQRTVLTLTGYVRFSEDAAFAASSALLPSDFNTQYEDFSHLTAADSARAPRARWDATALRIGALRATTDTTVSVRLWNDGQTPLYIRRYWFGSYEVTLRDTAVKPGKHTTLSLHIPAVPPGTRDNHNPVFNIWVNDPRQPEQHVRFSWWHE
jgi:Protein of unknown function (DUF1573)